MVHLLLLFVGTTTHTYFAYRVETTAVHDWYFSNPVVFGADI